MYYIELATGLRRGELLGLKWQDIDWKNGIIKVRRQVVGDDLVQSGALAIAEDGHTGSFRFNASLEGVHRIVVSWQIGTDAWKQPFLMNVVRP